jgi:nucleotide-binding universal stress UspA family protein
MIPMKAILCPVDFSEESRHALEHALALASWYHARVLVLHVHRLALPVLGIGPHGAEAMQPIVMTDAERSRISDAMGKLVAPVRTAGLPVETFLEEDINVPQHIVERARSLNADLITLGTHGRTGFQRWVLGSVAEKVLRMTPCPVMTVPPKEPASVSRSPGAFQRVVCPIDFSKSSGRALEYAASLASQADARLTVIHVVDLPPDLPDTPPVATFFEFRQRLVGQARDYMKVSISESVRRSCQVDELVLVGRPHREILRVAREQHGDLIVMGVQGRGALDLMFFGSTTNHVVRQAACPVVTVPAA